MYTGVGGTIFVFVDFGAYTAKGLCAGWEKRIALARMRSAARTGDKCGC